MSEEYPEVSLLAKQFVHRTSELEKTTAKTEITMLAIGVAAEQALSVLLDTYTVLVSAFAVGRCMRTTQDGVCLLPEGHSEDHEYIANPLYAILQERTEEVMSDETETHLA
jgi:hypothetical protein